MSNIVLSYFKTKYMLPQYYNKDFAKQFRNDCDLYFPSEEYKYGNLLIERFTACDCEMASLGKVITDKLFNTHLIYQIVIKMAKQDIPAARTLYDRIIACRNEHAAIVKEEPYTAGYYSEIILTLDSFAELIVAFRKDIVEKSSVALIQYYEYASKPNSNPVFNEFSLEPVKELEEYYLMNLLCFYNFLSAAWQYETNNGNSVDVTTRTAEYLQSLMELTENLIICMEDSGKLYTEWEDRMNDKDQQELYN